jgi:hypothetical protein
MGQLRRGAVGYELVIAEHLLLFGTLAPAGVVAALRVGEAREHHLVGRDRE